MLYLQDRYLRKTIKHAISNEITKLPQEMKAVINNYLDLDMEQLDVYEAQLKNVSQSAEQLNKHKFIEVLIKNVNDRTSSEADAVWLSDIIKIEMILKE